MARSRNIKPNFFLNEDLASCSPLARLLFAGLWCVADREGRLEDRPKRLKAGLLPYDECDADALLSELAARGFIKRYQVEERRYIAVPAFTRHQNPHSKEAASIIPAPGPHAASTVQGQEKEGASPADSLNPLTDPLVPESPNQAIDCAQERATVCLEGKFEGHGDSKASKFNPVAPFAIALNEAGFRCTAMNPDLIAFVEAGGEVDHLLACASQPDCDSKPAGYVIAFARRELAGHARKVVKASVGSDDGTPRSTSGRVFANIKLAQSQDQAHAVIEHGEQRQISLEVAHG